MRALEIEKSVNPKIASEIKRFFEPYENKVRETKGFYNLQILAMEIGLFSLKVAHPVYAYFELNKDALLNQICRKIRFHYEHEMQPSFYLHDIKKILEENNIEKNTINETLGAITKPMLINLSIADFYYIVKTSENLQFKKINFNTNINKTIKLKLKTAKSAITIVIGDKNTKLRKFQRFCDILNKAFPPNCMAGFAYNIKKDIKKPKVILVIGK
mgnify:CR=1 FL=1|tara:strand:+ start:17687 stop:18331 length:645 start_codon:yes stop_codon:yes gene_type:complete